MYFDSLHAVLTMQGHGGYVWTAYLVTVVVIVGMLLAPMRRRTRLLRQLSGELRRAQRAQGVRATEEP